MDKPLQMEILQQSPAGRISELRNMLGDRYEAGAVIKELIQNADDAWASNLHFAIVPFIPDSSHPMLSSMSLIVLNDGEFKPDHKQALLDIGTSSKAGDRAAVGKYGLGMKSLFHWCESFIYCCSSNQPAYNRDVPGNIVSPWADFPGREDWCLTLHDITNLYKYLDDWQHRCDRWFALVLPLRTEAQLKGRESILRHIPLTKDIQPTNKSREIAVMMPLLKSIEKVVFWDALDGDLRVECEIGLADPGSRRKFCGNGLVTQNQFKGETYIRNSQEEVRVTYCGRELVDSDPRFLTMQQSDTWPRSIVTRSDGSSEEIPDKALPHGAVVLCGYNGSSAGLALQKCVFLPLSDDKEVLATSEEDSVKLLLHGYYFLDSGRKRLKENNDWNDLLNRQVVTRLLLPTLVDFIDYYRLPFDSTCQLIGDIKRSAFYRAHQEDICADWQLLPIISGDRCVWNLIEADKKYYIVPGAEKQLHTAFSVFPSLKTTGCHVVPQALPRLTKASCCRWGDNACDLLNDTGAVVLRDAVNLQYMLDFLAEEKPSDDNDFWKKLVNLVQTARAKGSLPAETEPLFQQLIECLPSDYRVYVSDLDRVTKSEREALDSFMAGASVSFLLLPQSDGAVGRDITLDEAKILLNYLSTGQITPSRSNLALLLIRATACERADKLEGLGHFPIFRAQSLGSDTEEFFTWRRLDELHEQGKVFGGNPDKKLLTSVRHALTHWEAWRLTEDPRSRLASTALFTGESLPELDIPYCIDAMQSTPELGDPKDRIGLLRLLLGSDLDDDPQTAKALRYLLHGNPDLYDDLKVDLLAGNRNNTVWDTVAKWIYTCKRLASCILPSELTNVVAEHHRQWLGIENISHRSIEEELECDPEVLAGIQLTDSERVELLGEIRDEDLWKRLPIHRSRDGQDIKVRDNHTYLVSDYVVPSSLTGAVDVVIPFPGLEKLYQRLVPQWCPEALIKTALSVDNPVGCVSDILDAIEVIASVANGFDKVLHDLVQNTAWLPIANHVSPTIKPKDVIYIPELQACLQRLAVAPRLSGRIFHEGLLSRQVKDATAFKVLRDRFFTKGRRGVEMLGEALSTCEAFYIGPIAEALTEYLPVFARAFKETTGDDLQGHNIVAEVFTVLGAESAGIIGHYLTKPIPKRRVISCLTALQAQAALDVKVCALYDHYLQILVTSENFCAADLRLISLQNGLGEWKSPGQLTVEQGVEQSYVLDDKQHTILEHFLYYFTSEIETQEENNQTNTSTDTIPVDLKEYFRNWEGMVNYELIGLYLAMLGDSPHILKQAREWLEPKYRIKELREQVQWNGAWEALRLELDEGIRSSLSKSTQPAYGTLAAYIRNVDSTDSRIPKLRALLLEFPARVPLCRSESYDALSCIDVHDVMNQTHTTLLSTQTSLPISVRNLLGAMIQVEQSSDFDHLLLGNPVIRKDAEGKHVEIRLRDLHTEHLSGDRLRELLYETLRIILRQVFGLEPVNLGSVWNQFCETEQADIARAQRRVLRNAFFYFGQLNDRNLVLLRSYAMEWDDLEYRADQYRDSAGVLPKSVGDEIRKEQQELNSRLRKSFEQNTDFQMQALSAVRRKVLDYQYSRDSIPFEIFQNADDAVVQLINAGGVRDEVQTNRIEYHWNRESIRICHWGRPVNGFRFQNLDYNEARKHEYDRDLEKMLVLSFSSKSESGNITGKFGLGFKSVFLFSDRPQILSGKLGFEVVGGMYPKWLDVKTRGSLSDWLRSVAPTSSQPGTVFYLPSSGDSSGPAVMDRFSRLAHIQVIFARVIKRCHLVDEVGRHRDIDWQEQNLLNTGVYVGKMNPFNGEECKALVLRGEDNQSVLLAVGPHGFNHLSADIPTFWVTAPTAETLHAGFAINGNFDLDVGRARISCNSQCSVKAAEELADMIGQSLENLYYCSCEDWSSFASVMGLDASTDAYDFWSSLWDMFSSSACTTDDGGSSPSYLLRTILWATGSGMHKLVGSRQVVPSGLAEPFRNLVSLQDLGYAVDGILQCTEILEVANSLHMLEMCGLVPGRTVSAQTYERVRRAVKPASNVKVVRLADIVSMRIGKTKDVTAEAANSVGRLVNEDLFDLEHHLDRHAYSEELARFRESLRELLFETEDGYFRASFEILASTKEPDDEETLRAAFAPEAHLLNGSYDEYGISFFRICRRAMNAPVERLVEWGLQAQTEKQKRAFIAYMKQGRLALDVRAIAAGKRFGTWLEDPDADYFSGLTENQTIALKAELDMDMSTSEVSVSEEYRTTLDPGDFLKRVYAWWKSCDRQMLQKYDELIYPDADELFRSIKPVYKDTQVERKAWLELILRGSLETMGRYTPAQHKAFLQLCKNQGWIEELAAADDVSDSLVDMIRSYIDRQAQRIEYYQWIKQFVPMFLISKWLKPYANLFLRAETLKKPNMVKILTSKQNSELGPGDPEAPPIGDVLGIGAHFILRELVRKNVISSQRLQPLCYVPSARVRKILGEAGVSVDLTSSHEEASRIIHAEMIEYLDDGTFACAFDVPFQMIAHIDDLRQRFSIDFGEPDNVEDW